MTKEKEEALKLAKEVFARLQQIEKEARAGKYLIDFCFGNNGLSS